MALFVGGGGVEGVIRAIREADAAERVMGIGLDLTEVTRSALIDGALKLVLSHPLQRMAETLVGAMARAIERGRSDAARQVLLPFDIHTPENV